MQSKNNFFQVANDRDEWFTPRYAVEPILEFINKHFYIDENDCIKQIKKQIKILCPFDTEESQFVKVFRENGFVVECSHLEQGIDFFELEKTDADYIISNPPYSRKNEVLKKLYELDKPFAMLMPLVSTLETQIRHDMFYKNDIQLLIFDKRIGFLNGNNYKDKNGDLIKDNVAPPFPTAYFCWNMLPKDIIFRKINKKGRLR